MIKKKICILGEFGVGKTSVISRYANNYFSDRYLTTIGVSIKQKVIEYFDKKISLIIWDIAGEQFDSPINPNYLRGLSAFIIVCDVTQKSNLWNVDDLVYLVERNVGNAPYLILLNKIDMINDREIIKDDISRLEKAHGKVFLTSAKTGEGIEEAFNRLVQFLEEPRESLHG